MGNVVQTWLPMDQYLLIVIDHLDAHLLQRWTSQTPVFCEHTQAAQLLPPLCHEGYQRRCLIFDSSSARSHSYRLHALDVASF